MKQSNDSTVLNEAKGLHSKMIEWRRDLHMHPEIGFDVHRTAQIVSLELEMLKLNIKRNIGFTGVVADLIVPGAKKTIALRADMDALPIQEKNDVEYKSRLANKAHLCGHDAHTAMLLGAANILIRLQDRLNTNIRFIFQPNEEALPGGAPAMIKDGAIDNVDEIYALHVWPTLDVGRYGICIGPAMAQADSFDVLITGCGGHAAAPHRTINPIIVGVQIIQAIQNIVPSTISPLESAVVTVTLFQSGNCYNVVTDTCQIAGTVRTFSTDAQQKIKQKLKGIIEGVSTSMGATGQLNYIEGYPVTYNDEYIAESVSKIASNLVGQNNIEFPAQTVMFGEDFAYYAQQAKGCFIQLGCRNEQKGFVNMLHHPEFNLDEDCLLYGSALLAQIALSN
jgi:amidohydrolase